VLSSGFVAGQVIGGVLVSANLFGTAWRPVFLVNVPIGLAVLAPGCMAAGCVLAIAFLFTERTVASRGGDPLLSLSVFRAPGLLSGLAAISVLMVGYGGFLFSFALLLQAGLGDSALRAGLTFAHAGTITILALVTNPASGGSSYFLN
jgi:hypothetical protein